MIPEPFVWYLFKSLAQAAADAESNINGAVGGAPAQYVHQDIKPSNIFLAEPDASGFKTYPVPKLGDFDSGRLTSQADLPNPANWTRDGRTPHFTAPVSLHVLLHPITLTKDLGARSNDETPLNSASLANEHLANRSDITSHHWRRQQS